MSSATTMSPTTTMATTTTTAPAPAGVRRRRGGQRGEPGMSLFTDAERDYLDGNRLLGRLATVGADGMPHVAPVGWRLTTDAVVVTGRDFAATKKFRDVAATGRAAIVIDDVLPPWQPRGVEVRGYAEAVDGPEPQVRIRPTRIVSWGLPGGGSARTIPPGTIPPGTSPPGASPSRTSPDPGRSATARDQ